MKPLYTLIFLLFICVFGSTQNQCGTDHLHDIFLESDNNRATFAWMNEQVLDRIIANRAGGDEESYVIPTVIHVIHDNGFENISEEQVEAAIDFLNESYSNTGGSFNPDGLEIPIQFCIAKKDPEGNFSEGINYVQSELTDMLVPSEDLALKNLSRWNPEEYFNVWVVRSITREPNSPGVIGYSTFPDAHGTESDGVVIEADFFGTNQSSTTAFIHETGHYLGLFHTFQGGCPNDDCLTSGDMVCDTPPDNNLFNTFCFDGTNSCLTDEDDVSVNNPFRPESEGGIGDQLDMQSNYMDYSSILCFDIFTAGQSERMIAVLTEIRSSLLDDDKCTPPCNNPIIAAASASASVIDVGESITFTNTSSNYTALQWYLDGLPVSTGEEYMFTPTTQGEYSIEIELTNGEAGCYQFIPFSITVNCPISNEITPNSTNLSEGGTVEFEVSTTGATSFEWFVDNVSVGNTEEFSYTFTELGISSIYMIASNGMCEVQSQVWNISVGSCTSGNEHNIWHWFNITGNGYGFNFNEQPTTLLAEDPMVGYDHSKATICDDAGNLLFVANGTEVYDSNYDLLENGEDLLGDPSSHFGCMFLKVPGDDTSYYLFTSDSQGNGFSNGVRYNIIDASANNGLGAVTAVKNEFIEVSGTEHLNIVKHCNTKDKWLIFYDIPEGILKSYLIDETGVSTTPVESPLDLQLSGAAFSQAIKPTPQGNQLIYENYILDFDQATGEASIFLDLGLDLVISHDFSPNGKILYTLSGEEDIILNQYNLTLPTELIADNPYTTELTISQFGKDIQKGKDNVLYLEETIPGSIGTISFPNLLGANMDYVSSDIPANALINGFGNFYHAYVAGQDILIDGDEIICAGTEHEFSVFGSECIDEGIEWEFSGDGIFQVNPNETVSASFQNVGEATLIAKVDSDCGEITDTLNIVIIQAPEFDLGPAIGICEGNPEVILEMPDEFEFYLWSNNSTEQSITLINPAPQTITGTGYFEGCYISDEVEIVGSLTGIIDLGPDTDLCDGEAIILDAGPGYSDYLWQDGSTGQTHTVFLGGNYSVTVTEPCSASDAIFIDECDQSINVSELEGISEFSIYPNPISDEFTIDFTHKSGGEALLEIFDVTGKLVQSQYLSIIRGNNSNRISVDQLAIGEYVISLTSDQQTQNHTIFIQE